MDVPPRSITELLGDWGGGDEDALNALMPFVYQELHRLARRYLDPRRAMGRCTGWAISTRERAAWPSSVCLPD